MTTLITPTLYDHLKLTNKNVPSMPVVVVSESYILNRHTVREKYMGKPVSWWDSPLNTHHGKIFIELHTTTQYSFGYAVSPLLTRDDLFSNIPTMEIPDDLAYASNIKIYVFDNENKTINLSRFVFWIAFNAAYESIDWMAVNQVPQSYQPSTVDEHYLREHTILEIIASGGAIVMSVLYYLTHPAWTLNTIKQDNDLCTFNELELKGLINHASAF